MQALQIVADTASPGLPAVTSFDRLRSVLGAGEHLGDIVWWTLSDAKLQRTSLETIWSNAGLPMELLPDRPTAEKALRLAVREAQVGQTDHLIRLARDSGDELIYGIVRETKLESGHLLLAQEARVVLNRAAEALTSDMDEHELVKAVRESFLANRYMHTADELRRLLVRTLTKAFAAITLRDGGGVYWVPRAFAAELRRLEQAVGQFGESELNILPVHHSTEGSQTLGKVARGSLEQELAELRKEMEEFAAEPPGRASTLERRLEVFEEVRGRAQLYRDILKVQVDDLEAQLDGMGQRVREMLAG